MHLFTYGTLMVPEIMEKVSGVRVASADAILHDAVRYGVQDEEYPGVVRRPGEQVAGVVYFDLPDSAIHRLDLFEGDYYQREKVYVVVSDLPGEVVAMSYIFKEKYSHLLTGALWNFERFLKSGRAAFEQEYGGYRELY